jgi:hypothetical protein
MPIKESNFEVTATLSYNGRVMVSATRWAQDDKLAEVVAELGYVMRPLFAEQSLTLDVATRRAPSYQTALAANGALGVKHGA